MARLASLVTLAVLACLASSCAGLQLPKEQLTDPGALLFNGYVRPDIDCWKCHNGDGKGAKGPSLVHKVAQRTEAQLKETILEGDGFMPKFKGKLSDEEVGQLTRWMKATFPSTP